MGSWLALKGAISCGFPSRVTLSGRGGMGTFTSALAAPRGEDWCRAKVLTRQAPRADAPSSFLEKPAVRGL